MRIFLIIISNVVIFSILFFSLNYIFEKYPNEVSRYINSAFEQNPVITDENFSEYDSEPYPNDFKFIQDSDIAEKFCGEERVEFGQQYTNKRPIIIIGCSYAYGHGITKEKSFPYILAEATKRPVYSFSGCGWSPSFALSKLFEYKQKYPEKIKHAKYIIYVYMYDHINRMLIMPGFIQMKNIKNEREHKHHFFDNIFLLQYIIYSIELHSLLREKYPPVKSSLFMKDVILNLNTQIRNEFKNINFIVIVYNEKILLNEKNNIPYFYGILNSNIWDEMPTDIKVVKTKDIMGFKFNNDYKIKADFAGIHPNERAWQEFTPKFAEQYIK